MAETDSNSADIETGKKKKVVRRKRSSSNGRSVYIIDGSRTPQLKARNKPGPFHAAELAIGCGRPLLARQLFEPDAFDEVIMGCVMPGPNEINIGRVISLRLGCGKDIPAWTVQRNCASGMQALDCAAKNISNGRADLILAGGVEAMSHAPILFSTAMAGWLGAWMTAKTLPLRLKTLAQLRPAHFKPVIGLLRGLTDPVVGLSMGQTAENLAYRFNISREEMDSYAVRSHQRLATAIEEGCLSEVETLYDTRGRIYAQDDGVRADSSVEKLAKLRPVFDRPFGAVTAGNSAQVTDGAAMLILASEEAVKKHGLKIRGEIKACQWVGLEPEQMGLGPVHAITPLLKKKRLKLEDIDYWEINEAFAAQVIGCLRAWEDDDYCCEHLGLKTALGTLDQERLNIDGGGISLGHPVGASGARIVLHLLSVLERKQAKRGIASLCIGGGQGGAMLIERG